MLKNLKNFIPAEVEEKVLEFWRNNKVFEKSVEKPASGKPKGDFIFFDGPPFANGLPHYGHILASIMKDAIPRYRTMKGERVKRRWGWDCHGLPVEFEMEKELGLKSKKDIINYGIEKFNEAARNSVLRYQSEWEKVIPRVGRWVDMDNSYKTMDVEYMESVLWVFKNLYDKNLVYKGYKPMHICPRCETTLSNFEVTQNYKDIEDFAVALKFELEDEPNTFALAWTTTAWTLPGNVALAVNPKADYVKVKTLDVEKQNQGITEYHNLIIAKDIFESLYDKDDRNLLKLSFDLSYAHRKNEGEKSIKGPEIIEKFKGEKLVGKKYKPLFDYFSQDKNLKNRENGWKIYPADFVSMEEGTGIVHIAPAFGAEDMELGRKFNLPFVQHVGMDGKIKPEVKNFAGLSAKPIQNTRETDGKIIDMLSQKNSIFNSEKVVHSYPHCWRCETPLLNYAASSWFVKVTAVKNELIKHNKGINWYPEHVKNGRFGQWLKDARDWAISRSRFWGAPLPVWECKKCGKFEVIGSVEDIKKKTEKSGNQYFVLRHGLAESNLLGVSSSNYKTQHHLTDKGKKEVEAAVKKLKNIDLIFSSDFVRSKETAEIAAKHLGVKKIIYDKRLREINVGSLDNKPVKEYHAYFSSLEEKFIRSAPNGESLTDLKNRITEFIYEIDKKYSGKNILIVGHEYPLWLLFSGAAGADAKKSIAMREGKDDFIKTGEIKKLDFVPLPHNRNYELDLHRPYIDNVEFPCAHSINSGQACGGKMKRIEDVFDCWFESGSMPYGQINYPFEAKRGFSPVPAEFIAEGIDQTRGWFYTLLVLSTALFNKPAYKNVIVNGIVLAENGQKMSKRLKNYPDPMGVASKYGADSLRLYLLSSPAVAGENLNFSERGVDEIYKKIILRLWNVYKFYELYATDLYGLKRIYTDKKSVLINQNPHKSASVLDKWILARLEQLKEEVSKSLENYELDKASRPIAGFVDDFSTWYIRRSRERFKTEGKDKAVAIAATGFVLTEFSKILAPFAPFTAEGIYKTVNNKKESVHLEPWPKADKKLSDKKLIEAMSEIRKIASLALELRAQAGIKVRQPLASLKIRNPKSEIRKNKELQNILKDEINVKEIIFDAKIKKEFELDTNITPELKAEGLLRDTARMVQEIRKEAKLLPKDEINLWLDAPQEIQTAVEENLKEFKEKICARNVEFGRAEKFDAETETKIDNAQVWAGIRKI